MKYAGQKKAITILMMSELLNMTVIQFTMFMNDPNLKKLIVDLSEDNEITSS